jgi:hypothetical protein
MPNIYGNYIFSWDPTDLMIEIVMTHFARQSLLCRYLWRGKNTFAIAQHKHHRNIYEEADANKRRKRYARPLIDLHMKIYYYEGMKPWSSSKKTISGMPGIESRLLFYFYCSISIIYSILVCHSETDC